MDQDTTLHVCSICGREFRPRDAETLICPDCGGPPEAPAPSQPQETVSSNGSQGMAQANRQVSTSPQEWQEGDVILDLYEVKGEVGRGGLAAVYRVHHRRWNMDLAVKRPLPHLQQYADSMEAFTRQARAWLDLGLHPHIVTCYYVRRVGDVPCMFTEYIEGGSLKNWIEDRRLYAGDEREALKRILDVAIQFAWGLEHVHQRGFVHQNAGPGSALMTSDGRLKLAGFELLGGRGCPPAQAAPEQELGQAVSPRTDIWGWGVSVLEMFTGEVHWGAGSTAAAVLENYLHEAPLEGIPPMPAALVELLRQCFQNDPEMRPASMDEVAERLMRLYEQETGAPYPRPKPQALELRADSLNNKAVSLLDLGLEEEAVRCWQEALQADPAHLEANFNYGYYRWQRAERPGSRFLEEFLALETRHQSRQEYWDMLGWIYWEQGDMERLGRVREKIQDERLLKRLSGSENPVICEARKLDRITDSITSVSISENEQLILLGCTGAVYLYDLESMQRRWSWSVAHEVEFVKISPNGRYGLCGGDDGYHLWDLGNGEEVNWWFDVHKVDFSVVESLLQEEEWPYEIRMAFAADLNVRRLLPRRHSVSSIALSPDGAFALSGGDDGLIRLWNLEKKTEVFCLSPYKKGLNHLFPVFSVAFSADGHLALSGGDDAKVHVWDLAHRQRLHILEGHARAVVFVSFCSNDLYALSQSTDDTMRVWDLERGKETLCIEEDQIGEVENFTLLADNITLATHNVNTLYLWDIRKGKKVFQIEQDREKAGPVVFWDGRYVLLAEGNIINIWDLLEKRKTLSLVGHTEAVDSIIVSPTSWLAVSTSYGDHTIRFWNLRNGQEIRCVVDESTPRPVAFLPNSSFALFEESQESDFQLTMWKIYHPPYRESAHIFPCLARVQPTHEIVHQQRLVDLIIETATSNRADKTASTVFGRLRQAQKVPGYEHDRRILELLTSWGVKGRRKLLRDVWELSRLKGPKWVTSVAFLPTGDAVLLGSSDGMIHLWDIRTFQEIYTFRGHEHTIWSVAISKDGRYMVSGSEDRTACIWDMKIRHKLHVLRLARSDREIPANHVLAVAISSNGHFVLTGGGDLVLWDSTCGKKIKRFEGHKGSILSVAFSPDENSALSGSADGTIRLWDLRSQQEIERLEIEGKGYENYVTSVRFSPDGQYILAGSLDGKLRLLNAKEFRVIWQIDGHPDGVSSIEFAPDGQIAISGGLDNTVRIWQVNTGKQVWQLDGYQDSVRTVAVSPMCNYILASGVNNTVAIQWEEIGEYEKIISCWALDWDYDFPAPADWDEGARPYLDIFLTLHTPYGPDGLRRVGKPQWTEEDFQKLLQELGYRGYGWLRPEGVRRELEKMAKERK